MTYPLAPTPLTPGRYQPEWLAADRFVIHGNEETHTKHHCKLGFQAAQPHLHGFRNAVDVGCRDGEYTRYLTHHFEHAYCFDPRRRVNFPDNCDVTKATLFTCALGDEQTEITMFGGTHDGKRSKSQAVTYPCYRLDDFDLRQIDFMKIDVEGFERKVLIGAERTILRDRPLIVVEQHSLVLLPGEPVCAAKEWLESRGYRHVASCPRGYDLVMAPT